MRRPFVFCWLIAVVVVCLPALGAAQEGSGIGPEWTSPFGLAGTLTVGGDFSYESSSAKLEDDDNEIDVDRKRILATPLVEYFVIDRVAVFGALSYRHSSSESSERDRETTVTEWGPEVGAGYYFPLASNVAVFGRGRLGHRSFEREDEVMFFDQDTDGSSFLAAIGAGVAIPLGESSGGFVRGALDYYREWGDLDVEGRADEYDRSIGSTVLSLGAGVYFH